MCASDIIALCSLALAVLSAIYTVVKNHQTAKLRKEVEKVQLNVIQASQLYRSVKEAKCLFQDSISKLTIIQQENDTPACDAKQAFLDAYNRYTDFYNEVNDYCTMVNNGAIQAENYIRDTISVSLSMYAKQQCELYPMLNTIAQKTGLEPLPSPDYKAFKDYDDFLIRYNGGENSAFWIELKTLRKKAGFE